MAYTDQVPGSRRLTTIAGVAVIHAVIGYAFVSGMAVDFVRGVTKTITTTNVPLPEKPPEPQTLPPPTEHAVPQPTGSTAVAVTDPVIPSRASDAIFAVDVIPVLPLPPLPPSVGDEPAAPPSHLAAGPQVKGAKSGWITTDDYPPSAIRAEEEGVVGISVRIGVDGRVSACSVTGPSGSVTLDQAACRLYQRRARFTPARDDAGHAIMSTYNDRVRWELPR